jgi:hypothetical protein
MPKVSIRKEWFSDRNKIMYTASVTAILNMIFENVYFIAVDEICVKKKLNGYIDCTMHGITS